MYKLIREQTSGDTLQAIDELADGARKGEIVGLAFVAIFKQRRFLVDCVGAARREPSLTRGFVLALDDELRDMVHGTGAFNLTL